MLCRAQRHPGAASFGALAVLLGVLAPLWLAMALLPDLASLRPQGVAKLEQRFAQRGYDLAAVSANRAAVPRLFLKILPADWGRVSDAGRRKELFLLATLPLILRENERVLSDRRRLLALRDRLAGGGWPSRRDRAWLSGLAANYGLAGADLSRLLRRVDAVPVSLALAQAAVESGWGTSRFAVEGNALFGQWTAEGGDAMTPRARAADFSHAVRRFGTLSGSVAAYLSNLNRHPAYRAFRRRRAELRALGRPPSGGALAATLTAYSQRGTDYVSVLRQVMAENDLGRFDSARLARPRGAAAPSERD